MTDTRLGSTPRERLVDTRLQLHHAVQVLTSFAQALIDPMQNDRHRSFGWDVEARGLRTHPAATAADVTALFAFERFEVRIERGPDVLARIEARGATVERLRDRLQEVAREVVPGAAGRPAFVAPEFDLPDHPVAGDAAPFGPDSAALGELAAWLSHGSSALDGLDARSDDPLGERRVWPHHFDLGALVHAHGGSVGVRLSLGDEGMAEPYWYVRGYPDTDEGDACPTEDELPTLPHGRWKESGWTGAFLERAELASLDSEAAVDRAVADFLDATVTTCVRLLS